mgnify:FL=1
MTSYILKVKKNKFIEIKIEANNEQEARIKFENNDYDFINDVSELKDGSLEIVEIRKGD